MTCSDNDSVTDVGRITGIYMATAFIEPGEHDARVDILANGGILTAQLSSNFEVEGHLLIPDNIGSNFAPTDTSYYGEFNLDGDRLHFINAKTFMDHDPFMFIVKDARLETPDWTGHWTSTKIILEKQE